VDDLLRATARAEERHFWFRGFRWFVRPLIDQALIGRVRPRIIDCGCGTGANLSLFERYGTSYGFDRSEVGLYIGHQLGRRRLAGRRSPRRPSRRDIRPRDPDVLYSPEQPDEQACRGMLRLTRPAVRRSRRGDGRPARPFDSSHEVRRYTREMLGRLVTGGGFTIGGDY
jgi:SAM-dependent methyltransferase